MVIDKNTQRYNFSQINPKKEIKYRLLYYMKKYITYILAKKDIQISYFCRILDYETYEFTYYICYCCC